MRVTVALDDDLVEALDRLAVGTSRAEVIRTALGEWLATGGPATAAGPIDRAVELRADFDKLGRMIAESEGAAAAALARERRLIGEQLEALEKPGGEISVVDELAKRRNSAGSARAARRRRKP